MTEAHVSHTKVRVTIMYLSITETRTGVPNKVVCTQYPVVFPVSEIFPSAFTRYIVPNMADDAQGKELNSAHPILSSESSSLPVLCHKALIPHPATVHQFQYILFLTSL